MKRAKPPTCSGYRQLMLHQTLYTQNAMSYSNTFLQQL